MSLISDPFSYRITKSGTVLVSRGGRMIVTVAGSQARALITKLGKSDESDQMLLAKATGNYRHGNERRSQ